MKKFLSSFLVFALCISVVLTGCGNKDKGETAQSTATQSAASQSEVSNMNPSGEFPIVKEKITLKFLVPQAGYISDMATNEMTKYMEEKTNVHIDWDVSANFSEVKSVVLASGDYPDAILGGGITQEEQMIYGSKGSFLPLNDMIDKYGVEMKKMFSALTYVQGEITTPDGNIYAMPSVSETYHMMFRNKLWINSAWLKKLNLEMPKTTEELYNVMKAFKEQDPNGNGKKDEIPLSGIISRTNGAPYQSPVPFLMSAFITDDGDKRWAQPFDGKLDTIVNKPEFKEGLKFIQKLFKEGLLDTEVFTQTGEVLKQKGENPGAPLLGAVASNAPHAFTNMDGEAFKQYDAVPPVKGPAGVQTTAFVPDRVFQGFFVITDKCKYPEVAFRWGDWLFSEEATYRSILGVEGKDWRKAEANEVGINGKPAKYAKIASINDIQNSNWAQNAPNLRTAEWRLSEVAPEDIYTKAGFEKRLYQASKLYDGFQTEKVFPSNIYIALDKAAEAAQLKKDVYDYIEQSIAKFITADVDIDKEWDAYVKTLNDMGLSKYIELNQNAYDAVYGK